MSRHQLQWTELNGITLGETISEYINQMITITDHFPIQSMLSREIWGSFNLGQFDPNNRMIPLTVITLTVIPIIK
jgi:hypothetical protein